MTGFTINTENFILGHNITAFSSNIHLVQMYLTQIKSGKSVVSIGISSLMENSEPLDKDHELKIVRSKVNDDVYIITTKFAMDYLEEFVLWFIREKSPSLDIFLKIERYYRPSHNSKMENLNIDFPQIVGSLIDAIGYRRLDYVMFSHQTDYIMKSGGIGGGV